MADVPVSSNLEDGTQYMVDEKLTTDSYKVTDCAEVAEYIMKE